MNISRLPSCLRYHLSNACSMPLHGFGSFDACHSDVFCGHNSSSGGAREGSFVQQASVTVRSCFRCSPLSRCQSSHCSLPINGLRFFALTPMKDKEWMFAMNCSWILYRVGQVLVSNLVSKNDFIHHLLFSSVDKWPGYELDDSGVRFRASDSYHLQKFQTSSGAQWAFHSIVTSLLSRG